MSRSVSEVVGVLNSLPPERVEQVYDFALFLKSRQTAPIDESDEWSDEDLRDVTAASLSYADSLEASDQP